MIFVIGLMAAGVANAQQIMDGSGAEFSDDLKKSIFSALADSANDPYSAQIVKLKQSTRDPDLICGLINLKNGFGAYTGFKVFAYSAQFKNVFLNQNLSAC